MNVEKLTNKQICDYLANNGVTIHFNSKREKVLVAYQTFIANNPDAEDIHKIVQTIEAAKAAQDENDRAAKASIQADAQNTQSDTTVTTITPDMVNSSGMVNGVALEGLKEKDGLKLIRAIIRPNDPMKRDIAGEYISSGIGAARKGKAETKYIPYNSEVGTHIPKVILDVIKEATYISSKEIGKGKDVKRITTEHKAYNVEILAPLTDVEIKKLASQQRAHRGVEA